MKMKLSTQKLSSQCISKLNFANQPKIRVNAPIRPKHAINRQTVSVLSRRSVLAKAQTDSEQDASTSAGNKQAGRATYRPSSYTELIDDAVQAIQVGLADNLTRMEVEFPAVSNIDGYKGASDMYIDANIQLAISAGKKIYEATGKKVHVCLPDEAEYNRAIDLFKTALELSTGVTLGHLGENKPSFYTKFNAIFAGAGGSNPGPGPSSIVAKNADIFITLNASTVELLDLEKYVTETVGDKVVVAWNMELDTLRADLGLFGFPSKELQYKFLSYFKPVFYIRQRDYSKTVAVSPFIINYSGALFREYPGPWQVMLRQDNGVYACVAEDTERRYNLGEFKNELTRAMGLDTEAEGSAMAFLRSGYKNSTWWEDDEDKEESHDWRS